MAQLNPWLAFNQQQQDPTQQDITQASMAPAPQMSEQELIQQLQNAYMQSVASQQQGLGQARQRLADVSRGTEQMDLSPLVGLVDTWTGSNMLPSYRAPVSKAKQIEALQEAVLKAEGGLTETQRQALRDRLSLMQSGQNAEANRELARARMAEGKTAGQERMNLSQEKAIADYEKEYRTKYGDSIINLSSFNDKVEQMKKLIRDNGTPTVGAAAKEFERLASKLATQYNKDVAGLGALAGADLSLIQKGIGTEVGAVERWLNGTRTGGPAAVIKSLDDLLADADRSVNKTKERLSSGVTYKYISPIINKDVEIYTRSRKGSQQTSDGSVSPSPAKNPADMTDEELKAAYEKKKAAERGK